MRPDRAVFRIGEVARRTGVAVSTLRAWERRYGLLEPTRTDGGHRLYSDDDVARVTAVQALIEQGWSASAAADEVRRSPASVTALRPVSGSGDPAADLVVRLQRAFDEFDTATAEAVLDDVFARLDPPAALDEVILPALRWMGEGWEDDDRVVAREHLSTNVVRPRLQRILRSTVPVAGHTLVAAAPEHEEHDLGLLAASVVAATRGWRVHFLGARTPTRALERAIAEVDAEVVLVGALFRRHAEEFLASEPDLGGLPVVLGGVGFREEDRDRLTNAVLHTGSMRALPDTIEDARQAAQRAG